MEAKILLKCSNIILVETLTISTYDIYNKKILIKGLNFEKKVFLLDHQIFLVLKLQF